MTFDNAYYDLIDLINKSGYYCNPGDYYREINGVMYDEIRLGNISFIINTLKQTIDVEILPDYDSKEIGFNEMITFSDKEPFELVNLLIFGLDLRYVYERNIYTDKDAIAKDKYKPWKEYAIQFALKEYSDQYASVILPIIGSIHEAIYPDRIRLYVEFCDQPTDAQLKKLDECFNMYKDKVLNILNFDDNWTITLK